ncbi:Predicted membrane protein [Paenibacillaceae bacterium GAS479]|nr:Predicted membrane protein [Paenibacillaceae bacterium GAS479]
MSSKLTLRLLSVAATAVVAYALYKNYVLDPQSTSFLSRKPDSAQPNSEPVWLAVLYVHITAACLATLCGLLGFSPRSRRSGRARKVHRWNGYIYFVSVFIICLTSGYMAPYATGGKWTSVPFNLLSILWPAITVLAIHSARQRRLSDHKRGMVRSYAFCFNNLTLHMFTNFFYNGIGLDYTLSYTLALYTNIAFLLAAGEGAIRLLKLPKDSPIQQAG